MARTKFASPTLKVSIPEEEFEKAKRSNSGGCLIADGIRRQYPHLSKVTVDMATIRATDRKAGVRYTYLTPPQAQHLLLGFDQGWPQATDELVIRQAVKITPIVRNKNGQQSIMGAAEKREQRREELEAKELSGEALTRQERSALTRIRNPKPAPERPSSHGKREVRVTENRGVTIHGGRNIPVGKAHPNLLRGRDRHFGAKLADPGLAFNEAVEAAVSERLAKASEEPE